MKILVVTNMYPTKKNPFYGIFVKEQVESLKNNGVSIDVLFINGKNNRLNYVKSIVTLMRKIRLNKYDILHAHHTYCVFIINFAKLMIGSKTPIVLTFHEGEVHFNNSVNNKNADFIKRLMLSNVIKKLALKMSNVVITVQQELIDKLKFNGNSITLPCGVDTNIFKPMNKKKCREMLGLPYNKKIIFFPASPDNNQKGFDILKQSVSLMNSRNIFIQTAGNIFHEKMPFYMNAADVVVQLSIFEASPSVLKEALAVNTPVVFTDCGDTKKIVENVHGCYICNRNRNDIANKLNFALDFNGKCNGRNKIFQNNLSLSTIALKLIEIYKMINKH
jgi:glycosyltransferase involved in cell wall biosynthesis